MALTQRDKLGILKFEAPRVVDVGYRDDAFGTVRKSVAGDRERPEDVNDHCDAAGSARAGLKIEDLYFWMARRHFTLLRLLPAHARAICAAVCLHVHGQAPPPAPGTAAETHDLR